VTLNGALESTAPVTSDADTENMYVPRGNSLDTLKVNERVTVWRAASVIVILEVLRVLI
jgi:hypothetical protein